MAKASPAWLISVVCGVDGVAMEAVEEFYRFQNPTRWFLVPSNRMHNTVYENLHGKHFKVPGTDIYVPLEFVEKEKSKLEIHWLPATYNEAAVKVVVTALTGDCQPEVYRLRNQEGKWGASCRPTRPIPHYAAVEVPGREQWHNIKIRMPGRLTECQYCSETSHWSNKCPNRCQTTNIIRPLTTTDFPPPRKEAEEGTGSVAAPSKSTLSEKKTRDGD